MCSTLKVQQTILEMMDMSSHSIVASEVAYLAAQWNELPTLKKLEATGDMQKCAKCPPA